MYNTNLTSIPNQYRFNNLTKLVVSFNPLDLMSFSNDVFPHLEYLDISYVNKEKLNDITPICRLSSLKYLVAEDMSITNIPKEIKNLKRLREVSFLNNSIESIPNEFYSLKLKLLNLEYNVLNKDQKERLKQEFPKSDLRF